MEVLACDEPRLPLEHRQERIPRGAGIRRRLEDDEMARPQALSDLGSRRDDDREIRLALLRERRREGDEDRVRVAQDVVVGRRGEAALGDEIRKCLGRDVLDVAVAAPQALDALPVDVDEHDSPAGLGEHLRQGDADVARADDGDLVRRGLGGRVRGRGLGGRHGAESYRGDDL